MRRTRRRKAPHACDLFTPPPTRPTWDKLPEAVTQKVTALLAEILLAQSVRRPRPADGKEAEDE